jgi:hypothetical protein
LLVSSSKGLTARRAEKAMSSVCRPTEQTVT